MLVRYSLASTAMIIVLTALFAIGSWYLAESPEHHLVNIIMAAIISVFATIAGFIPMATVLPDSKIDKLIMACFSGMAIRMLLTLIAIIIVYFLVIDHDDITCFALWNTAFYLCVLVWETAAVVLIIQEDCQRESSQIKSKEFNVSQKSAHTCV